MAENRPTSFERFLMENDDEKEAHIKEGEKGLEDFVVHPSVIKKICFKKENLLSPLHI